MNKKIDPKYERVHQNISSQIQKVKMQLQEKLQEMMPLPEVIKMSQMKLKEAKTMHRLVDRNNKEIAEELNGYKNKIASLDGYPEEVGGESKHSLILKVHNLQEQLADLQELNDSLKNDLKEFQKNCDKYEKLAEAKLQEITTLESHLENLLEKTKLLHN